MTTFDHREHGYENKFAHDKEMEFNIIAYRNKLLGIWAAEKMALDEASAKNYATGLVEKTAQKDSSICVLKQIEDDFSTTEVNIAKAEIEKEMERLLIIAREKIING